jgi:hypothetical protein
VVERALLVLQVLQGQKGQLVQMVAQEQMVLMEQMLYGALRVNG